MLLPFKPPVKPVTKKNISWVLLVALFVVAAFVRMYGLADQDLLTFDEHSMMARSLQFQQVFASGQSAEFGYFSPDTKILWLMLLTLQAMVFPGSLVALKCLSAIFALLTILMTYWFSRQLYRSEAIGLLSALFLSVSATHIYYSRGILPETATAFCVITSVSLYALSRKKTKAFLFVAGAVGGVSFLLNRLRAVLLPVFVLIYDLCTRKGTSVSLPLIAKRLALYLLSLTLAIFIGAFVCMMVFKTGGIRIPPIQATIKHYLGLHQYVHIDPFSFLSIPYFIVDIEGLPILFLFLGSLLFLRSKHSTLLPLCIVAAQVVVFSIPEERFLRSLSVVLPFLSILNAVTLVNLYEILSRSVAKRVVFNIIVIGLCVNSWIHASPVIHLKQDISLAYEKMRLGKLPKGHILTTQEMVVLRMLTSPDRGYAKSPGIGKASEVSLQSYQRLGYAYVLVQPKLSEETLFPHYWELLGKSCSARLEFQNDDLLSKKLFLFEHNHDLKKTLDAIRKIKRKGHYLKLYDIQSCLNAFEKGKGAS